MPLLVLAGKEYGSGSSRDWAAKGTMLLGVKAVIAESFERIHRSNLVNMGVLPLEFAAGQSAATLGLTGREVFDLDGSGAGARLARHGHGDARGATTDRRSTFTTTVRIDTPEELTAFKHGGILPYVLRKLAPVATLTAASVKARAREIGLRSVRHRHGRDDTLDWRVCRPGSIAATPGR